MKSKKLLSFAAALVLAMSSVGSLVGCANNTPIDSDGYYVVAVDPDMPTVINVGDTVDFKQYFVVVDKNGNRIMVTDEMIDASKADTSKEGQFTITLKVGGTRQDVTFTVKKSGDNDDDIGNGGNGGNGGEIADLSAVFALYADSSTWNFATQITVSNSSESSEDYYEYCGYNILNTYDYEGDAYTDYLGYDVSADAFTFYYDNGDGTYDTFAENSSDFEECVSYMNIVDLTVIGNYEFVAENDGYVAKKPNDAGNNVLCEYEDSTWTSFKLIITNGKIARIVATSSDGYTFEYVFGKYGSISFTLPDAGSSTPTPVEPTGVMSKQTYNAATFDDERLQKKLVTVGDEPDFAIGLPSTGTYSALVVPIKFTDTAISDTQLANLDIAFNGTEEQTGWESVKTYYRKASYGKLDLSFDIAGYGDMSSYGYYTAKNNSSYYEKSTATENGQTYNNGDNLLLHEVLKYYENKLDLTKYDSNDDGVIDAVYLIYSAPVDYDSDSSFYWAYVTWNYDETKYDNLDAYYYLFAGLDFMKESVSGGYTNEYYPAIPGLKVNASTYIHETGHLLGLDDYYDYDENSGSNEGLGGADMMDATVGDQNVYSKTMLGWMTPTIVTTTQTITIKSSQERGDAILIPLDFNNSFFCEYLLIDLYSAQGLNALHANMSGSYLYDGASYGVRIYHVSSWVTDPFNNEFGSFTDCNNSMSTYSLIKLVEADGDKKFGSDNGYAAADDLWQKGDKLSTVFPKYTTNAGKTLIFDISIDNVSASEATITVTYNS